MPTWRPNDNDIDQPVTLLQPPRPLHSIHDTQLHPPQPPPTRSNNPWGDLITNPPYNTKHTRLYSLNINGLYPATLCQQKIASAAKAIHDRSADIFAFSETNCNWERPLVYHEILQPFRKRWKHLVLQPTTPDCAHNPTLAQQPRLQGGASLGVTGPLVSRIIHRGQDQSGLGRWAHTTFRGKDDRRLTIISAYCPVNSTGPNTVHQTQLEILSFQGRLSLDPIKLFYHDITNQINEWQEQGHDIILAFDANASLPSSRLLRNLLANTGLSDIHEDRYGNSWSEATHQNGSHRIDFILVTPPLQAYISAAGIEAFHELSDHRGLFIDIDLESYLGKIHPLDTPASRRFHSKDRKAVLTIRHEMRCYAEAHNMFHRCETASQALLDNDLSTAGQLFLSLDADLMRAFRTGENKLKPRPSTDWSPPVKEAYRQHKFWLLHAKEFYSHRDFSARRSQLSNSTDPPPEPLTIQTIREHLRLAKIHLIETSKMAAEHRAAFLESLCQRYEQENKPHLRKIVNGIRAAEAARKLWHRIKITAKRHNRSTLTHLKIPNSLGSYDIIDDPEDILDRLIQRNINHFTQATGTPFTKPPLLNRILPLTSSTANLMEGDTTDFLDTDDDVLALLAEIATADKLPAIQTTIDIDTWIHKIGRWKESTATSPSGIHLGLEKALITFEEDDPNSDYQKLLKLRVDIINGIIQCRVIPKRWHTVISVMIEKIPNNPDINKLRTIQLMEADFNLVMGILWNSRLQRQAERYNELGNEQYGVRKGFQAIDMVAIKNNLFAISEASRTSLAMCDMDAKACFDRVVMPLALLRSQQLGIPAEICDWIWHVFREMRYHIKTSLGVSDRHYEYTDDIPLWGNGQGGKASPPIWVHLDTLILRVLQKRFPGFKCTDPAQHLATDIHNTVFMDDAATIVNRFLDELLSGNQVPIDALIADLQHAVDQHSRILTATGGKLELPKCFFYVVQWKFNEQGIPAPADIPPAHNKIQLRDQITHSLDSIPIKSIHTPHRTLGAHISPTGNQADQINALRTKAMEMTQILHRARFSSTETLTFLRGMAWPALTYPLAASAIPRHTLDTIQAPLIQAALQSLHFNKNYPRALAFGPTDLGGLNLPTLYTSQGQAQVLSLIRHARGSPTSLNYQTTWTALRWIQTLVGSQHHFLSDDYRGNIANIPHWYRSVKEFLTTSNLSCIVLDNTARPQRTGDIVLMDHHSLHRMTTTEVQYINAVRLYLTAETLADLTTSDGTQLRPGIRNGSRQGIPPARKLFPRQPKPGKIAIRTWNSFISHVIGHTGSRISPPLGAWTDITQRHWPAIATKHHIALKTELTWELHKFNRARCFLKIQPVVTAQIERPPRGSPVDIWQFHTQLRCTIPSSRTRQKPSTKTLHDFLETLQPWEQDITIHTKFCEGFTQALLSAQRLTIASDGGVKNEEGAFSWVLDSDGIIIASNSGVARGFPMQSFRAEAYGTLSALSLILRYCEFQSIPTIAPITHHCDNEALVKKLKRSLLTPNAVYTNTTAADHDILSQITQTVNDLPAEYSIWHVRSHQDDHTEFQLLPRPAQLNVLADRTCTRALRHFEGTSRHMLPISAGKLYISHNGTTYTSGEKHLLQRALVTTECEEYLHHLNGWNQVQHDLIDWHIRGKTLRSLSADRSRFVSKLCSRWLPVGTKLQQTDQRASADCPFCRQQETLPHLFSCPQRTDHRRTLIEGLAQHLFMTKTAPPLLRLAHDRIKEWLIDQHSYDDVTIGPDHPIMLLFGYIPSTWRLTQQRAHQLSPDEYHPPEKWAKQLLLHFWQLAFAIWEARNHEYHRNSPESTARQDTEARVRTLYEQRLTLPPPIRKIIFPQDIATLLRQRTTNLLQWITTTKAALAKERRNPTPLNGMHRITTYPQFRPRPSAAVPPQPSAANRPRPTAAVASLERSSSRR